MLSRDEQDEVDKNLHRFMVKCSETFKNSPSNEDLIELVKKIYIIGGISEKNAEQFISASNKYDSEGNIISNSFLRDIRKSLTHYSFDTDSRKNNREDKNSGDISINKALINWLYNNMKILREGKRPDYLLTVIPQWFDKNDNVNFVKMADILNLQKYISWADVKTKMSSTKDEMRLYLTPVMKEYALKSLFNVLEKSPDRQIFKGIGDSFIYNIFDWLANQNLIKDINDSVTFDDLQKFKDPKSKITELVKSKLNSNVVFNRVAVPNSTKIIVNLEIKPKNIFISSHPVERPEDGETEVSAKALTLLKKDGIEWKVSEIQSNYLPPVENKKIKFYDDEKEFYYYNDPIYNFNFQNYGNTKSLDEIKSSLKVMIEKMGNVDPSIVNAMLYPGGQAQTEVDKIITRATTHKSVNQWNNDKFSFNNYELFEKLGDKAVNKAINQYLYNRLQDEHDKEFIFRIDKAQSNLHSKEKLSELSKKYNFNKLINWKPIVYITSDNNIYWQLKEDNNYDNTDIGEDSFESILGLIEVLANRVRNGLGYVIVYNILSYILDREDISFDLENLVENITKLKEIYDSVRLRTDKNPKYYSTYYKYKLDISFDGQLKTFSISKNYLNQKQANEQLAKQAIAYLNSKGIFWRKRKSELEKLEDVYKIVQLRGEKSPKLSDTQVTIWFKGKPETFTLSDRELECYSTGDERQTLLAQKALSWLLNQKELSKA